MSIGIRPFQKIDVQKALKNWKLNKVVSSYLYYDIKNINPEKKSNPRRLCCLKKLKTNEYFNNYISSNLDIFQREQVYLGTLLQCRESKNVAQCGHYLGRFAHPQVIILGILAKNTIKNSK